MTDGSTVDNSAPVGAPRLEQFARDLTRRQLLAGLSLGALALAAGAGGAGCAGQRSALLPGPKYPDGNGPALPALPTTPPPRVEAPAPRGVIPRSQWTRTGIARPRDVNPMNGISRITVHHDAIPSIDVGSMTEAARRIETVRTSHVVSRGWADIGYHYVIDPSGRVWEGRSLRYQGAHVENNNEHNLGIVLMGNFDQHSPTPQALATLDRFIGEQMARYNVGLRRVYTHREINPTACPGRNLQWYMTATRARGGGLALAIRH